MDVAPARGEAANGRLLKLLAAGALALLALPAAAPPAQASLGYEPASPPTLAVQGEEPAGVAIDQSSQDIYVAIPVKHASTNLNELEFGQVDQLDGTGTPTAASPFSVGPEHIFTGVAVNPVTHSVYAVETEVTTPIQNFGTPKMDRFSSSGTLEAQFSVGGHTEEGAKLATDSAGNVFVPNAVSGTVRKYSSTGSLLETIACTGCPGGGFKLPTSVALDAEDNLYVVDVESDRVVKFTHPSGHYVYSSVLQSGRNAGAVAVDPSLGFIFVGDYPSNGRYHIVAYDSTGVQFDDFGAGLFGSSQFGAAGSGQIAVNATTHKLYVTDPGSDRLRVFERATMNPPTVTTVPASPVGQIEATMRATVNANFHATTDCHFEYVDDAAFQANGYTGAAQAACASLPDGSQDTVAVARVSSLASNTTYHYRAVAANNAGSVTGGSQTFTTMQVAPAVVTTEPASTVTMTGAKLNGKVNPHGGTVSSCRVEYGPTASYGTSVACPIGVAAVDEPVSESATVKNLLSATTYHYRLAVTTNAGTVEGADEEFTTLSPPPVEEPPAEESTDPAPPPPASPALPLPTIEPPKPPKKLICRRGFQKRKVRGRVRCVRRHRRHRR